MNQDERRKSETTGNRIVDEYVRHLPEMSKQDFFDQLGKPGVVHIVYAHDDWCQALKEGGGLAACNCNPQVEFYTEPKRS